MAGVIVGSAGHIDRARSLATRWGLTATPFDSWLAVRGLRTLQAMKVLLYFSFRVTDYNTDGKHDQK